MHTVFWSRFYFNFLCQVFEQFFITKIYLKKTVYKTCANNTKNEVNPTRCSYSRLYCTWTKCSNYGAFMLFIYLLTFTMAIPQYSFKFFALQEPFYMNMVIITFYSLYLMPSMYIGTLVLVHTLGLVHWFWSWMLIGQCSPKTELIR